MEAIEHKTLYSTIVIAIKEYTCGSGVQGERKGDRFSKTILNLRLSG